MEDEVTKLNEVVYKSLSIDKSEQKLLKVGSTNEKSSWFLYISAIVANLFMFSVASGFSWTSSAAQMLQSNDTTINPLGTPVTPVQESWIASLYSLGAAVGPIFAGKLSDTLGRKKTLLIIAVPKLICLLVLCFATNITVFYVCRFIMGLVLGTVFAVTPLYLSEISEVHNRGTISTMLGLFMNSGVLFGLLVGPLCSIKILTFLCALPLFAFIIFFGIFIPETPVFLLSIGQEKKAVQVLQQLRGTLDVHRELGAILNTLKGLKLEEKGAIDLIKDNGLRKALIVIVGLMFASQFSGVNPIISYCATIFKASGSGMPLYLSTNLVGGIQVVGTFISAAVVEKLGRKLLLLTSSISALVCHVTLALYFYLKDVQRYNLDQLFWLPVAFTLLFIFVLSLGLSPLPFTVMGEIFPHSVKAVGSSLGSSACFAFSFIITFGFRIFLDKYGMGNCYLILSGFMFVGSLFIYFVVPETKGKSETEIQQMLKK